MAKTGNERYFHKAYDRKTEKGTKGLYADWAAVYDIEVEGENGYAQPVRCAEALISLAPDRGLKILDIGCGTGLSGEALKSAGYNNLDGCDFSPEMLAIASKKSIYERLFPADLNSPPLDVEDQIYDAATMVGVFSFDHVSPNSLDDILRIVKPGGVVIIGLNDHYYDEGSLKTKLADLESAGSIEIKSREHGDHLPGHDVKGWVITAIRV